MYCNRHKRNRGTAMGCRRRACRRRAGFSFIEVMVVVVIIGMLAGAVTLVATGLIGDARASRAKQDIATIMSALNAYHMKHAKYPESLDVLIDEKRVTSITDPWGKPYRYEVPGEDGDPYLVYTFGADDREGGEGDNADVFSSRLDSSDGS